MTDRSSQASLLMRKRLGAYLKRLREDAGLTQRDMAETMGYNYYTMISQIERGLARPPVEDILKWAEMLRVDQKEFGKTVLYWTDPHVYHAIFGVDPLVEQGLA